MEMTEIDLLFAFVTASVHAKTGSHTTANAVGLLSYAWAESPLLWSGAMYFFRSL